MFPLTPRGPAARSVRFNRRDIRRSSEITEFSLPVVALRIERSAAALSEPLGRPALDYRASRIPRIRTENFSPRRPCCCQTHSYPSISHAGFEPALCRRGDRDARLHQWLSLPCGGFEPTSCGLKGRHPKTSRPTGRICRLLLLARIDCVVCVWYRAHSVRTVGREALESSSPVLRTGALGCWKYVVSANSPLLNAGRPLRREPTKKARRRIDAGPCGLSVRVSAKRHGRPLLPAGA
jgi:hypothetical protein